MKDEDLLKCPLLQGLDAMHRAELVGLLNDSSVRQRLEECLAERTIAAAPKTKCSCEPQPGNFEKEVHSWKPQDNLWRRSAKE